MFDVGKIIRIIQKNTICPICKRKFDADEIKFKGIIENVAIFELGCANNHQPIKSIHIVILQKDASVLKRNLYKEIEKFDGDFIKLWKK